jgi:restriction system protein
MHGVFSVLAEQPEGLPANEVLSRLETVVPPTPYEDADYPHRPGVRRREKIVRFGTIAPVKAGWLRKDKGVWRATEEGLAAHAQFSDPVEFAAEANRLYRAWKKSQPLPESDDDVDEAEIQSATSLEEAEETATAEIRAYLLGMNPYDFQDLVATLLKAMGYHVHFVSPPGPDRGLDIVAYTDPLGAAGPRIKVQVKRRADRTSVDGLRSFLSLLAPQDIGLFVTTGGFTSDAEREARSQESRRLTLIDLDRLLELWIEYYDNIPDVERGLLPLRPVYFLDPRD